jgi:hypothetical protein
MGSNLGRLPITLPSDWVEGMNSTTYKELALRPDQALFASTQLELTATMIMAMSVKKAVKFAFADAESSTDSTVHSAFWIANMVRNAFAHDPIRPVWKIDRKCKSKTLIVPDVIEFITDGLEKKPFEYKYLGGRLAVYSLCRFVRFKFLKDTKRKRKPFLESDVPGLILLG